MNTLLQKVNLKTFDTAEQSNNYCTKEVEQWYVRHNYFYCLIT